MKKEHQKELVIAIVFFFMGFVFAATSLHKTNQLNKMKNKKIVELIWNKYEWKTKRLRVYTDIIYKND